MIDRHVLALCALATVMATVPAGAELVTFLDLPSRELNSVRSISDAAPHRLPELSSYILLGAVGLVFLAGKLIRDRRKASADAAEPPTD